ncbi:hypothetical protein RB653_005083 [Dictyostelium firmibasis]|uniref:RNase III domain-containing protein n=1 Tax=Dictyostelium firmibasis TaxID=79012 RepID=A0AAN7U4H8_9MYCE
MITISFNSSIKQLKERGVINIFHQPKTHRERFEILEFHGDSTLSYLISTYLLNYKNYYNPHLLTKLRSLASSNQLLCDFFNLFELEDFLSDEELPRDCKNIKPRADIVECLISELSQSKDIDAELLLKGIIGFLISAGEKELDREFPHIIDKGILKTPKSLSPSHTTLKYKSNFYNGVNNSSKLLDSTSSLKDGNKQQQQQQFFNGTTNSNNKNNSKDINIKQPKAIVSYVVDNKSPSPLASPFITPSSLSGGNIGGSINAKGSSINCSINSLKRNSFEVNLIKPIDLSNSNSSIIIEKKIGKSGSYPLSSSCTTVVKSKEILITPNNVDNISNSLDGKDDFLLSPFSAEFALISNS